MPWHIEERDDEFCVIKDSDGESEGCHPTRAEAERQMRALYANERTLPGGEFVVRALPEITLEPSEGDGSLGVIGGYAALFGVRTEIHSQIEGHFIEQIKPGAFENAIEGDRDRYRMLYEHGTHPKQGRIPLGPIDVLEEVERGLRYRGRLLDTEFNREILPGLKSGLYGSSFLGRMHYGQPEYPGRSDDNPDGLPVETVEKVRPLIDVGPTPFPAYLGTTTSARSLTDELVFHKFGTGEGLQKFAEWARAQASGKVQMPMKPTSTEESARSEPPAKPAQDAPDSSTRKEMTMAVDIDRFESIETLAERKAEIAKRVQYLGEQFKGRKFDTEVENEWQELKEEAQAIDQRVEYLKGRQRDMEEIVGGGTEPGSAPIRSGGVEPAVPETLGRVKDFQTVKSSLPENIYDLGAYRMQARSAADHDRLMVEGAKRAIELGEFLNPIISREEAQENVLKTLLRATGDPNDDPETTQGRIAQHYLATGSKMYRRAFGKLCLYQDSAALSPEEANALYSARALSLTGASGGFAVPFELDPTMLITSSGTINYIRQISRVEQITVDEWRGITSAGVTTSYAAEATETTDNAPTLVQPVISTEKAQAFVPFSIEIGMDWDGLQVAIANALQESKDELEASKFVSGTGTNEPFGVLTGTTNTVNAAAGQTFTLANLYSLLAALPPRYRSRAAFMGNLLVANRIRQFDTAGGAALWVQLSADVPAQLLGRPFYEASDMADVATSVKFLLFGDFSRFVIVDRIGLSVDLIPHLVGTNHRPTGQRGIYAFWRNGSKVIDANAFRALLGQA